MTNKIKCPNCGNEFEAEAAVSHQIEEKLKKEFEMKISKQAEIFSQQKAALEKDIEEFDKKKERENELFLTRVEKKVNEEKLKIQKNLDDEQNKLIKQHEEEKSLIKKTIKQDYEHRIKLFEEGELSKKKAQEQDYELKIQKLENDNSLLKKSVELEYELKIKQFEEEKNAEQKVTINDYEIKLKRIEEEKNMIKDSTKEEYETEIKRLNDENEKRKLENATLKDKELEILKKEDRIREKEESINYEIEKTILLKKEEIENEVKQKEKEKFDLKSREYEKKLADQMKLVEEMKRKSEQGSMQMQGEVQELLLEEIIKSSFPIDEVEEVPKGVNGADIIHKVKNNLGQLCGTIIWESKRTKNWSSGWINKLKDDQRNCKAEIAIILSSVLPNEITNFGLIDGIWVTNYQSLIGLTTALRLSLIELETSKKSIVGKDQKMEILYKYIYGVEFKQRMEVIVDNFRTMKSDLDKEKDAIGKIWAKREKQIQNVVLNTVGMRGDLEGIIGETMPLIESIELSSIAKELSE